MEQSPTWEANRSSASQEILPPLPPRVEPEVHYRIHKRLPPVPILSQSNSSPGLPIPHPENLLILSSHYSQDFQVVSLRSPHHNPIWMNQWPLLIWYKCDRASYI